MLRVFSSSYSNVSNVQWLAPRLSSRCSAPYVQAAVGEGDTGTIMYMSLLINYLPSILEASAWLGGAGRPRF